MNETLNERFNRLNPCSHRKSYRDTYTNEFFRNRCVMRKHPRTLTGVLYSPNDETSLPWITPTHTG